MYSTRSRQASLPSTASRQYRRRQSQRNGAVVVEFALVLPLLFLFFFGAFEFCRVAMIRHTADNAVYEGVRRGIIPGGTREEIIAEAQRVLDSIGINNAEIDVTPTRILDETTEISVQVTVPIDSNSFVPVQYFVGRNITRELTMRREGQ